MKIEHVLEELQMLFAGQQTERIEEFLSENLRRAMEEQDTGAVLAIVNELIGFYRDTSQFEKMLLYCQQSLKLMERLGMEGTNPYAKALLNVANAYRAAGMHRESLGVYEQVRDIYQNILAEMDLDWAAYYNNLSLLHQEMSQYEKACDALGRALAIVEAHEDTRIKQAVSHSNLAASLLPCNRIEEAQKHIEKAMKLFAQDEEKDFHYSAAATAAGDLYYYKKMYEKAARYYEEALMEQEKQVGRTAAYYRILGKLQDVYEKLHKKDCLKGMSLAEEYYELYGKPMIQEKFPEYEQKIAVGLAGEGSDCLEVDDVLSKDHDFGPGFCMWVTDETYEVIGEALQQAYEGLPRYLHGISRQTTRQGANRIGVCRISDYYKRTTGYERGPETIQQWLDTEDYQLCTAVSGKLFRDEEGIFTGIRNHLKRGYPKEVFQVKLAQKLALAGQSGQCNYARMMSRGQVVPASVYISRFACNCMEIVYYLNRQYPPYEKWLWEGMSNLTVLPEIKDKIEQLFLTETKKEDWENSEVWNGIINRKDKKVILMEEIAARIIEQLRVQGLTSGSSNYLESHGQELARKQLKDR